LLLLIPPPTKKLRESTDGTPVLNNLILFLQSGQGEDNIENITEAKNIVISDHIHDVGDNDDNKNDDIGKEVDGIILVKFQYP
jgi:hypothetical protein